MIDKNLIGHEFEAVTLPVEEGRLRFVAKSIGETNPVYSDPEAARKAGHPALPAPPTFVFMLEVDAVDLQDLVSFLAANSDNCFTANRVLSIMHQYMQEIGSR